MHEKWERGGVWVLEPDHGWVPDRGRVTERRFDGNLVCSCRKPLQDLIRSLPVAIVDVKQPRMVRLGWIRASAATQWQGVAVSIRNYKQPREVLEVQIFSLPCSQLQIVFQQR